MRKLRKWIGQYFSSLKLATRLTFFMVLFMVVPAVAITALSFGSLRRNLIEQETEATRTMLYESIENAEQVMRACSTTAQVVLEDRDLFEQVDRFRTPGPASALDAMAFRDSQIAFLSRLTQANPHLYAVRLYVDDRRVPELAPALFHMDRMKGQPWYTSPLPSSNTWKFGFDDRAFPQAPPSRDSLAVLLNEIRDTRGHPLGILEVSVPMASLFGNMYGLDETHWMGFVDATGKLYYDKEHTGDVWGTVIGSVVYGVADGGREYTVTLLSQGDHTVLAAGAPIPQAGGHLIRAVLLDDELRGMNQQRFLIYAALLVFNILCVVAVHGLVRRMLGRFYKLTDISRELQRGNLNVDVPDMGQDEIGEFAASFRETIDRIQDLLETSVQRETLVKTTEIRALQNQINSHFIYNVLEAIKMMAEIDEKYEISDAVTSLGKLLRYSMKWVSSMVTLQEELDYIENYIALLNLRYDYTITLSLSVPEELLGQKVPKMSLQPIIENAVYHGIEGLEEDAVIRINIRAYDGYYEVEITDSGKGMDPEALTQLRRHVYGEVKENPKRQGGIGLRNVQNRIRLGFGSDYGLRFYTQENCYMKVVVRLPLGAPANPSAAAMGDGKEKGDG